MANVFVFPDLPVCFSQTVYTHGKTIFKEPYHVCLYLVFCWSHPLTVFTAHRVPIIIFLSHVWSFHEETEGTDGPGGMQGLQGFAEFHEFKIFCMWICSSKCLRPQIPHYDFKVTSVKLPCGASIEAMKVAVKEDRLSILF